MRVKRPSEDDDSSSCLSESCKGDIDSRSIGFEAEVCVLNSC